MKESRVQMALRGLLSVDSLSEEEAEEFFEQFAKLMGQPSTEALEFFAERRRCGLGVGADELGKLIHAEKIDDTSRDTNMPTWVRAGWMPIVNDAVAQLRLVGVEVLEAREKMGKLRIHVPAKHGRRTDVVSIVQAAAAIADRTCDLCGEPGVLQPTSAWRVRCIRHAGTDPWAEEE